ncbi:acyl-CoA N-acyltransferase [Trichoderma citrinoviride]|uniref:Acyl-CoA N-acyltransferase n=1 Tax=Trichoderma citrinoviride TaxID=58853 RepID=A0A2T4BJN7_9HYPO|nr:acyl-CoA N-acyltransferase [Trichoderma citrinoviride]PTB69526.1 acyl-CoA N-acyltransferase [Trichoderma citrinoviride]
MAVLSEKAVNDGLTIRRAKSDDIPLLQAIVNASYSKYIDRIGKPPAPMLADYAQLLTTRDIFVLETTSTPEGGEDVEGLVGSIVLGVDAEGDAVTVNNLVVEPAAQGRGYGRVLMDFAEEFARGKGLSCVSLYTNVKMHENVGLYLKLGYVETERRTEDGYERVYFRKTLQRLL